MLTAEEVTSYPCFQEILKRQNEDIYRGTPFYPLKILASRSKGSEMENIVEHWMKQQGIEILKKRKKDNCDRKINSSLSNIIELVEHSLIELKGSFMWAPEWNRFTWQQLREADKSTGYIFSAYYVDRLEMYFTEKEELFNNLLDPKYKQHGGKDKEGNTRWFSGLPSDFPFLKRIA